MNVIVQHEQAFMREALRLSLSDQPDLEVTAAVGSLAAALAAHTVAPADAVVLASAPDTSSRCGGFLRVQPACRLIALGRVPESGSPADQGVLHAVVAHAEGVAGLVAALRSEVPRPPASRGGSAPAPAALTLTARERQVLDQLRRGLSGQEVAARLGISPKTVDNHKQRIFTKLGVQSQSHAVSTALRLGLVGGTTAEDT